KNHRVPGEAEFLTPKFCRGWRVQVCRRALPPSVMMEDTFMRKLRHNNALWILFSVLPLLFSAVPMRAQPQAGEVIVIDGSAAAHPLPHFWEKMFGSGRAIMALRESYRPDLRDVPHAFWFKPNVSPPKDYAKWDNLITRFTEHLVDRYGIGEVSQWYFEVWNEPNIDFWAGDPRQPTYWELYDHTAPPVKAVTSRLRVGGPATAQAAWADAFIKHCVDHSVPIDFISSHVYGNDKSEDVFGTGENIPRNQMVCR